MRRGRDRLGSMSTPKTAVVLAPPVEQVIRTVRGHRVILDADIAALYGVLTKALVQAVKRNPERFPNDFMFRLTRDEADAINRSQIVTSSQKHRDPRYLPYAFTDYGVSMLSSVLRSDRAILVNIEIMRAFGRLREILISNRTLALRLDALERKYDRKFRAVFDAIRDLMAPPRKPTKKIGFQHE